MSNPLMVCVGSAAQDVFLMGDVFAPKCEAGICYEHLKLGDKLAVEKLVFASGGNAMNASVTFARQGLETSFVSVLGVDPAGQALLDELDKESIHTKHVTVSEDFTTAYSVILLAPNGERTILNYKGDTLGNHRHLIDDSAIRGDWLYVSSVGSMALLRHIIKLAHANGMKVAFNPATYELGHIDECAQLLAYVDLFAVNREEAQLFVDGKTSKQLVKNLAESVQYVVVSDGPRGAVATDGTTVISAGMYDNVAVIDRTGAGDAFTSGFVASIAQSKSLEQAIIFASANSTNVVTKVGAKPGILHAHTKLHNMTLKTSDLR